MSAEPNSPPPLPASPSKYAERLRRRKLAEAALAPAAAPAPAAPRAGGVLVAHVIATYLVVATGAAVEAHRRRHGAVSPTHAFLAFFLSLNALICFWELALAYRIDFIAEQAAKLRAATADAPGARFAAVGAFFAAPCPPARWLSFDYWSRVWYTYALYDPSYADRTTFGFWVDATNGHVTLPPTLLWLVGMTRPVCSARLFGVVGLLAFYQELLGTVVYFSTFVTNGRYRGKGALEVALFVGLTNGLWVAGPAVGMAAALRCVFDDDYGAFAP